MIITSSLQANSAYIREQLKNCDDVIYRFFTSGDIYEKECLLIFTDGITDKDMLSEKVLEKIMASDFLYPQNDKRTLNTSSPHISVPVYDYKTGTDMDELISSVLSGNGIVLIDGIEKYIVISATKMNSRSIQPPESKGVIRGPRDAFTENFLDSTSLLRRRLKTKELKMEYITVGTLSPCRTALCYIKGRADKNMVEEIRKKLSQIDISTVIDSGQIQNMLSESRSGIIPDIQATERADDAAFALTEGKIVILTENSPFALIIPGLFLSMLSSSEDYYATETKRKALVSLRIFSAVLTILLPAIYIGFVKFNPDLLPDKIIVMLTQSRKNVAFPPFLEMLFMQLVFEIILEAAIRLPGRIASTVGIVGSIVVGQAIVDANLVNIMVVIIVAVNAILTFVVPSFELSKTLRLLRLIFMVVSASFGIFGTAIAFVVLLIYLSDMDSFGTEFLFPFTDYTHPTDSAESAKKI